MMQPGQPLPPSAMRAAQADRERTVDVLKAAFAEGRLSTDEYQERVERAQCAQTYGQLGLLVRDLPVGPMPGPLVLGPTLGPMSGPALGPLLGPTAPPSAFPGYPAPPWPPVRRPQSGAGAMALTVLLVSFGTLVLTLLFLAAVRHG